MAKKQKGNNKSSRQKRCRCFKYAVTVALNYEQIGYHPERISKIKHFIGKCDWKEIE